MFNQLSLIIRLVAVENKTTKTVLFWAFKAFLMGRSSVTGNQKNAEGQKMSVFASFPVFHRNKFIQILKFFLLFLPLCWTDIWAQPELRFHHQPFPQPFFSGIERDSKGFTWVSSKENLYRFDGTALKSYGLADGLKSRDIQSKVFEDNNANLWFCTNEAIYCYISQTDAFERFVVFDSSGAAVEEGYHLFEMDKQKGLLLLKAARQLYWFDIHGATGYLQKGLKAPPAGLDICVGAANFAHLTAVVLPEYGKVYCLYDAGLSAQITFCRIPGPEDPHVWPVTVRDQLPEMACNHVLQDQAGIIWLATDDGLVEYNTAKGRCKVYPQYKMIRHLAYWPAKNQIWIASGADGLLLFDIGERRFVKSYGHHIADPYSIADNNIQEVFLDHESNLWLSIWTQGIDFTNLHKMKFGVMDLQNPAGTKFVPEALTEDNNGGIWISSRKNGLAYLDPGKKEVVYFDKIFNHVIQAYSPDDHTTLVSTFGNLYQFDRYSGKTTPVKSADGRLLVSGAFATPVSGNRMYFSKPFENGIWLLQNGKYGWQGANVDHPAISDALWGMLYTDRSGKIYAEKAGKGLIVFDTGFHQLTKAIIPFSGEIKSFAESDSSIWAGGDFGLLQINKYDFTYHFLGADDHFPDIGVCGLVIDRVNGEEGLWAGTGKGLVWYSFVGKKPVYFEHYDGLQGLNFSPGSYLKMKNGTIWFGGTAGLNFFSPEDIKPSGIPARPYLQSVTVNDQPYVFSQNLIHLTHLDLSYDENNIGIKVGIIEFCDPQHSALQYLLTQKKRNWSSLVPTWLPAFSTSHNEPAVMPLQHNSGFFNLEHLAPGNYILEVWAVNSDGEVNTDGYMTLEICINPPFWQTVWFACSCLLLCCLGFYFYYQYRVHQVRRQESKKREVAREKAELEIKATRAQMNTHFIKNILNSIDGYILDSDILKASSYLVKCSELMDKVLLYSIHPFITLKEELLLLEEYVNLAAMGWRDSLQYTVVYDENQVDIEMVKLPTMLLQPFVENALIHGLKMRKGEKVLMITVQHDEQKGIICTIQDNGIPDKVADYTEQPHRRPHAIQIARERLRLYDLKYHTRSEIEVRHQASGTTVNVCLGHPSIPFK